MICCFLALIAMAITTTPTVHAQNIFPGGKVKAPEIDTWTITKIETDSEFAVAAANPPDFYLTLKSTEGGIEVKEWFERQDLGRLTNYFHSTEPGLKGRSFRSTHTRDGKSAVAFLIASGDYPK